MIDPAHRRAVWLLALAVPVTAAASLALVIAATASADVRGAHQHDVPGATTQRAARLVAADLVRTGLDVPAMLPGDVARHCVVVLNERRAGPAQVRVYGASSGPLVGHLDLSLQRGPAGTTCDAPGPLAPVYSGPLSRFGDDGSTASDGHRAPAGGAPVPYVVEVSLDDDTPNGAQGATARLELIWEVSSGTAPR